MATSVQAPGRTGTVPPPGESRVVTWLIQWVKTHRQAAVAIVIAVVGGAGLIWWNVISQQRTEAVAGERLAQARLAFESGNYPLAASELSQVVENYAGTSAAEEAQLVLGQVRLHQGQPQQAIEVLTPFAAKASAGYRAQAYGLLGAAYENAGRWREAAQAYAEGVTHARYDFLKAQYLSDEARASLLAGDTTKALEAYRTITAKYDSTPSIVEAKVRLGELTRGAAGVAGAGPK
ncbi:MAG TPA: tetratricopeptide repeat protein [Gemmatimonadales bacterium]|nr:tetratricopeptide repeat protein [Gemmatimonadales bacterium]